MDGPTQPHNSGDGPAPTKNMPTLDLPANLQTPNPNQYTGDIPPDLKHMMENNAPPNVVFPTAGRYYKPVVMGTISSPPISGGPLLGFEPMTNEGRVVIEAFYSVWYEGNRQTCKFFTWDEAMALTFSCSATSLADAIGKRNPQKGTIAHIQVEQFAAMLGRAGVV